MTTLPTTIDDPAIASELEALLLDEPVNWFEANCRIIDKARNLVPFQANSMQCKILHVVDKLECAGKPIRLIVLKARQHGVTTLGRALQFRWCNRNQRENALISAHKDDSSVEIFSALKLMQDECPRPRKQDYSNRKEIIYSPPHRSGMLVKTAGQEDLGRGTTITRFHGSEVAFWPNASKALLSVLQCVPDSADTCVILESTANGVGGEFYNRWQDAVAGKSSYVPIFLAWFDNPEYRASVPVGFCASDEEIELAELYGLDDSQLQWRRMTLVDKCGGDSDKFKQEYPSCPGEAFLSTGRPVFPLGKIAKLSKDCTNPKFCGWLRRVGGGIRMVEDQRGPTRIWKEPDEDRIYAIGGDTAEGLDKDESNDPDAQSAHCIDVAAIDVVAKVSGQIDCDEYAEQLELLGEYYCHAELMDEKYIRSVSALLGIETNNTSGGAVRECLKRSGYNNLYRAKRYEKAGVTGTETIGWLTNKVTREIMISDLIRAVREGWISIPSHQTVQQMSVFIRDKTGKPIACSGEHDDDVISLAITLQMAIAAAGAGNIMGYFNSSVPAPEMVLDGREDEECYADSLARTGAVDMMEDMEEDDDE